MCRGIPRRCCLEGRVLCGRLARRGKYGDGEGEVRMDIPARNLFLHGNRRAFHLYHTFRMEPIGGALVDIGNGIVEEEV